MSQLMLFETESQPQADGSLVVRPRRLCTGVEITVQAACKMLGYRDKGSVYHLIETRQIVAWKPKSDRGNARYRIDLQSVLEYKAARPSRKVSVVWLKLSGVVVTVRRERPGAGA